MAIYGRDIKVKFDGVPLLGTREKTYKLNGEALDISDDYSNGYQVLCDTDANNIIELTVSGIEKDDFLRTRKTSGDITGLLELGDISFDAVLTKLSYGLKYNDINTYEATFISTGSLGNVDGVYNGADFGVLFSLGYEKVTPPSFELPAIKGPLGNGLDNWVELPFTATQAIYTSGNNVSDPATWGRYELLRNGAVVTGVGEIYEYMPNGNTSLFVKNTTSTNFVFSYPGTIFAEPYTGYIGTLINGISVGEYNTRANLVGTWRLNYYDANNVIICSKSVTLN